jgi:hypothetical protein
VNLCKDCKHFAQEGNATLCRATAISLIDGEARHSVDHCAKARSRNGRCGLDGRLYEGIIALVNEELAQPETPAPKDRKPRAKKPEKPEKQTQETTDAQAE